MAGTEWVNNLKAEVLSPSKLTLTWSLSGTWEDLEQRIWCRNSGSESGEWAFVYDVHEDAKSFTWTDCSPGQSYDFCVGARNAGGSWYYGYLYGVPMDAILSASVAGADVASGDVEVAWERNPDASLGRAELWCRDEAGSYATLPDAQTTSGSFTFEGLPGGRAYDFWVRQRYSEGGYTDIEIKDFWLPGLADLRWEYADDRTAVRLKWKANEYLKGISGEGAAAVSPTEGAWSTVWYEDRATPGGWVKVDSWIPATQEEYTVPGLQPGHAYRFCARIRDFGYPVWAEGIRDNDLYTPFVAMPALATPRAVADLMAEYSKPTGKVVLSWRNDERNADAVMQPYDEVRVYRQTDGAGEWALLSSGSVAESYSDEVPRGHSYRYKVVPSNAAGSGPAALSAAVAVAAEAVPAAPTRVAASFDPSTRRVTVSWSIPESWERPVSEVRVYRSRDGGDFSDDLGSASGGSCIDQAPTGGHSYRYLVQARNAAGWGDPAASAAVEVPPQAPAAPTGCAASLAGAIVTVSWSPTEEEGRPCSSFEVHRSVNGGPWELAASLGAGAASWSFSPASDSRYSFRVLARNAAGASEPSEPSDAVYTPPGAPAAPTARRVAGGACEVSWERSARYAAAWEVLPTWLYDDLGEWMEMTPIPALASQLSLIDHTAQTDAPMAYRVRCAAGDAPGAQWSEWSPPSAPAAPLCAPSAPVLASPSPGQVVPSPTSRAPAYVAVGSEGACAALAPDGPMAVSWRHSPLDGSAQTAAQVRMRPPGGQWAVAEVAGDASELADAVSACGIDVAALEGQVGSALYASSWEVSVRTRGALGGDGGWGQWTTAPFSMRRRPEVSFASPAATGARAELSEFPASFSLSYADFGFELADMSLAVHDARGAQQASASFGAATRCELAASDWSPENHAPYMVTATARSTSGLASSAVLAASTAFPDPKAASLRVECDAERGWARVVPHVNMADGDGRPVGRMDVWRVSDGASVLVASGLSDGEAFTDRFPPLNKEISYRLAAYSDQGVYSVTEHRGIVRSDWCFLSYGDGLEGIARGMYALSESSTVSRSRVTSVEYAGRKYPVVYDGGGVSEGRSVSFMVDGFDELEEVRRAASGGRCYYRSPYGAAFHCTASLTEELLPDGPDELYSVTVELARVDGDAL